MDDLLLVKIDHHSSWTASHFEMPLWAELNKERRSLFYNVKYWFG
jgi:hypothetical protein